MHLLWYTGNVKVLDDDGQELAVPQRMAEPVRWLVTEAAQVVQDSQCSWKIVINLGRGDAPPKTVIERHQVL
jgi:hypothetical protein